MAGLAAVGLPLAGSAAFGLSWALSGIVFSAVAGVAAQLTVSHRAAIGLGVVAVATAYVLRAVGDLAEGDPGWLSWLSPIGWSQQIRPFAGDRWWVTALPIIATAILVPIAFILRSRRDLGSGLIPDRLGHAEGRISSVPGLTWRLQRGMLLAWVVGVALMGFVLGSVAQNVSGLLDSEQMREFIAILGGEQALVDSFLAAEIAIFGAIVSGYAVTVISRLRTEEASGHAELLLATPERRVAWAASTVAFGLLATAAVLLVGGLAVGVGHAIAVGDPSQVARLVLASMAQIPAAWVIAGIVVVLFGWLPRAVPAAWGILVGFIVLGEFGALWQLPTWVLDLSPFAHSPTLPGQPVDWGSIVGLLVVAAFLVSFGLAGWRRRDLAA
jgi:ABC-2 type transport system permease protein